MVEVMLLRKFVNDK